MQRPPSPVSIPNTFRDSNEITTKRELVQPSAPSGERMDFSPPLSRRSIIRPVEDDDNSTSLSQTNNKSLMKSIIRSNDDNDNDDYINTINQEQIQNERANNDNDIVLGASGYDRTRLEDLSADEAFARQLQEEEYSRDSLATYRHAFFPFRVESIDEPATASALSHNSNSEYANFQNDEEFAAHLQRQEQTSRSFPRNLYHISRRQSSRTSNDLSETNEDEDDSVQTASAQSFPFRIPFPIEHDSDESSTYTNFPHPFFQLLLNRNRNRNRDPEDFHAFFAGLHRVGHRRSRNLQDTEEDFGPEDYEQLLQLDDTIRKKKLTKDQINSIPIESFRRTSNNTDEENKCGICLEQFEINQTLRRFPCRHIYHKECGDRWLQENNACPICREAPIKVQPGSTSRPHRQTNSHHHHQHHHNSNSSNNTNTRRTTHTNRNAQPAPAPSSTTNRPNHFRRGGPSQRPS